MKRSNIEISQMEYKTDEEATEEMGFDKNGNLLLADEISPDTCRLRSRDNVNKVLDKDLFRLDLGDLLQGYKQVLKRIE